MIAFNIQGILEKISKTGMANSALARGLGTIYKCMPENKHTQSQEQLIRQLVAYECLENASDLTHFGGDRNLLARCLLTESGIPNYQPPPLLSSTPLGLGMAVINARSSQYIAQAISKALTGKTNIEDVEQLIEQNVEGRKGFKDIFFNRVSLCPIL